MIVIICQNLQFSLLSPLRFEIMVWGGSRKQTESFRKHVPSSSSKEKPTHIRKVTEKTKIDKIQYFSVFTQDHTHSWENRPISIFIYSTLKKKKCAFLFVCNSYWRKCLELDKNCLIVFDSPNWLKQLVYFWCSSQITLLHCYP